MVQMTGIEPARAFNARGILSPLRLPVPPHGHIGTPSRIRTYINQLSVATGYKPAVLPLNYGSMVARPRNDRGSEDFQSTA